MAARSLCRHFLSLVVRIGMVVGQSDHDGSSSGRVAEPGCRASHPDDRQGRVGVSLKKVAPSPRGAEGTLDATGRRIRRRSTMPAPRASCATTCTSVRLECSAAKKCGKMRGRELVTADASARR